MLKKITFITLMATSFQSHSIISIKNNHNINQGLSGRIEAEFNYEAKDNKKSEVEIDSSYDLKYRFGNNVINLLYENSYQENNNIKSKDSKFLHLRHISLDYWNQFNLETFIQYQDDEFEDLSSRKLIGSGLGQNSRIQKFGDYELSMYYFGGVFYEDERSLSNSSLDKTSVRLTLSGRLSLASKKHGTNLFLSFYHQPKIDSLSDYRTISDFGFETKFLKHFNIGVRYEIEYDSNPFNDIYKKKENISTFINYNF
jgi:hypothetical protein